jgi:hypothetical protein
MGRQIKDAVTTRDETTLQATDWIVGQDEDGGTGSGFKARLSAVAAWLRTNIANFSASVAGTVPASGGGTSNYLRADGSWAPPPGSSLSLDGLTDVTITTPASGSALIYNGSQWVNATVGQATLADGAVLTAKINDDAVTYAKLQNVSATDRILGRQSSGAGDVEELVCTAAGRALLDDADASAQRTTLGLGSAATQSSATFQAAAEKGAPNGYAGLDSSALVSKAQLATGTANSATYLRGDGTWATPSGTVDYETGSFSPSAGPDSNWQGFPAGDGLLLTFNYVRVGVMVTMYLGAAPSPTKSSTATSFELNPGVMPAAIRPSVARRVVCSGLVSSGVTGRLGSVLVGTDGKMTFNLAKAVTSPDAVASNGSWEADSLSKGLQTIWCITYAL